MHRHLLRLARRLLLMNLLRLRDVRQRIPSLLLQRITTAQATINQAILALLVKVSGKRPRGRVDDRRTFARQVSISTSSTIDHQPKLS